MIRFLKTLFSSASLVGIICVALVFSTHASAEESNAAEHQPLAGNSLLLDITKTKDGWVAVGERGHVLLSSDGESWQQSQSVPTKTTLTAVVSMQGSLWAVGHDALILFSSDGGNNWVIQNEDKEGDAFMDILFLTQNHGFAIGAYGLLLETTNAGKTWEFRDLNEDTLDPLFDPEASVGEVDEDDYMAQFADLGCYEMLECHLNTIVALPGSRLLMMGERGFGFRSSDSGKTWQAIRLQYEGSMFGSIVINSNCVLTFGLRGNAFQSCDFGANWRQLETGTEATLMGGALNRQQIVLVGASGTVVTGFTNDLNFTSRNIESGVDFTAITAAGRERYLLTSTAGVAMIDPDTSSSNGQGNAND